MDRVKTADTMGMIEDVVASWDSQKALVAQLTKMIKDAVGDLKREYKKSTAEIAKGEADRKGKAEAEKRQLLKSQVEENAKEDEQRKAWLFGFDWIKAGFTNSVMRVTDADTDFEVEDFEKPFIIPASDDVKGLLGSNGNFGRFAEKWKSRGAEELTKKNITVTEATLKPAQGIEEPGKILADIMPGKITIDADVVAAPTAKSPAFIAQSAASMLFGTCEPDIAGSCRLVIAGTCHYCIIPASSAIAMLEANGDDANAADKKNGLSKAVAVIKKLSENDVFERVKAHLKIYKATAETNAIIWTPPGSLVFIQPLGEAGLNSYRQCFYPCFRKESDTFKSIEAISKSTTDEKLQRTAGLMLQHCCT